MLVVPKVHLLRFKSVDTTMRIAEEFLSKKKYIRLISTVNLDSESDNLDQEETQASALAI